MNKYSPEGKLINTLENKNMLKTLVSLEDAMARGEILEARALVCDSEHNITVDLPCAKGIIPRIEGAVGIETGETKDIALITKVNKPVCFKVINIINDGGTPTAILSRRAAQEDCIKNRLNSLKAGTVIDARVTHLEQFGCFVDVGCGVPSLIPIDAISVSRISHPSDRFYVGQDIKVIIKAVDDGRVWLSHKELLGTWRENAGMFKAGETVSGIVRSVEDYGVFIELAPNLAGLAEPKDGVETGCYASVYIKALIPEKMKVKLIIVDLFDNNEFSTKDRSLKYFIDSGHIDYWKYTPDTAEKLVESRF
ncbi:MAG: S1 RNA-binding domain-containing protein [Oscillospiraceae bacterium]|jgi:small subunit ribosomal protein S1|nr:S1 RNA-binding domain-containing protein [Oscillospiraceae bacterium]